MDWGCSWTEDNLYGTNSDALEHRVAWRSPQGILFLGKNLPGSLVALRYSEHDVFLWALQPFQIKSLLHPKKGATGT